MMDDGASAKDAVLHNVTQSDMCKSLNIKEKLAEVSNGSKKTSIILAKAKQTGPHWLTEDKSA